MQEIDNNWLKTWREKYRWPYEESRDSSEKKILHIENLVKNSLLEKRFDSTKQILAEIVRWKAGPQRESEMLERFNANSNTILANTISRVLSILRNEPNDVKSAMNCLVNLSGVGIPVASAIIRFLDPTKHCYGVIDTHVAVFLNQQMITKFDLREGDNWIKKYPPGSCKRNIQEYQTYHNWLQVMTQKLQRANLTYIDIYGAQQPFTPVDIDMAIFAFMTQSFISPTLSPQLKQLEMHPSKPFTNLNQIYQLMKTLKGLIQVLDKDLDSEVFKFLLHLNSSYVRKLKILAGKSHLNSTLKEEYKAFRDEMQNLGISVEFRILDDKDAQEIHDRYLISDYAAYNTPPWNVIHKKLGDIIRIEDHWSKRNHFDKYWSRATDILKVSTK